MSISELANQKDIDSNSKYIQRTLQLPGHTFL